MSRKLGFALLLVIFAATFVRLGMWQLDRAQVVQEISKPVADKAEVEIKTLISFYATRSFVLNILCEPFRLRLILPGHRLLGCRLQTLNKFYR